MTIEECMQRARELQAAGASDADVMAAAMAWRTPNAQDAYREDTERGLAALTERKQRGIYPQQGDRYRPSRY